MHASPPFLQLGTPVSGDATLDSLLGSGEAEVAWRRIVEGKTAPALARTLAGIRGPFAMGLRLDDQRAFLAVDRFAVHTLCYRVVDGRLVFAERADALADEQTGIDPQAIFEYLYFHVIPSPRTIYEGIHRLPPGHFALFENGSLRVQPYWTPAFEEHPEVPFETNKARFLELLEQAVATQVDGGKPGCFLSGGTDSSTVAGMLVRASGARKAASYSIGFEAQGYDEMEFARISARHFQTEHHEYYVTPVDLVDGIPKMAAYFDQPFGNSSVLPAYYCARMAREDGVTRLLAGDGGDELFGGNLRYAKQRVFGWYDHVPGGIRRQLMEPLLSMHATSTFAPMRKAASYVEQAREPMPDRLRMYNLITRIGIDTILTDAVLARIDTAQPLQLQRAVWSAPAACSALNRELAFDWRFTLAESDLPKVRSATGFAGVAVGYPMLDERLLAFSLGLPTDYKLKGLKLRWFFKEALRGFLPDATIAKKKQGFGLPFGVWAVQNPALKALAGDSLKSLAARGVVRPAFVDELLSRKLAEHPGYYGEMVWILMMLEQWLAARVPRFDMRSSGNPRP